MPKGQMSDMGILQQPPIGSFNFELIFSPWPKL